MRKLQIGITILILGLSLSGWKIGGVQNQALASQIKDHHLDNFRAFKNEVDTLSQITSLNKSTTKELREQLVATRLAYKRVEFLFDYFHTKFAYLNINGGPLMKLDEDNPALPPIKPNGLQALDELVFNEIEYADKVHIDSLSQALKIAVQLVSGSHESSRLENHIVIEAIRSGLIRVFTLGVTGFDTPGSGNGLLEAEISMASMKSTFGFFESSLKPEAERLFIDIAKTFDVGVSQLHNKEFDRFDRMKFLKDVINPLYKSLLEFKILNGISQKRFKNHAHNYQTSNLFAADFLDKSYFQELSYVELDNTARIELGKLLFYDPILSKNLNMSCASCHSPSLAFTDGIATSKTNTPNKFVSRNAPTLIDATFSRKYFHDLRSANLERQVPHVFESEDEFDLSFTEVIKRLEQSETYKHHFKEAYKGIATRSDINQRSISNALAAYVNSLISFNSEFDKYVLGDTNNYPASATRGFNLFMGKAACGTCHFPPAFNGTVPPFYLDSESEVLGVTIGLDTLHPVLDNDPGRYSNGRVWDKQAHFLRSFKTPGLRNVALTFPYMHNGTFETLEEVMEFYNQGGGAGLGLEVDNQTLSDVPLHLSDDEQSDIISFLQTLTDTSGLQPGKLDLPRFENKPGWDRRLTGSN